MLRKFFNQEIRKDAFVKRPVDVGAGKKGGTVVDLCPAHNLAVKHRTPHEQIRVIQQDVWVSTSWTMEQLRATSIECSGGV